MKELIEKIKEISTKYKSYTSNEMIIHANNRGVVQGIELCLKEIQEQESKPFNPVEFGFDVDIDDSFEIRYTKRNKKNSTSITFDKEHEMYFISNYVFSTVFSHEAKNIIIPNHRFGVELLRNLGVIE